MSISDELSLKSLAWGGITGTAAVGASLAYATSSEEHKKKKIVAALCLSPITFMAGFYTGYHVKSRGLINTLLTLPEGIVKAVEAIPPTAIAIANRTDQAIRWLFS